jgi:bacterial leucyl aminopeptidase
MKASLLSSLLLPAAASARFIEATEVNRILPYVDALLEEVPASSTSSAASTEKFLVELSPGETRWITEDEKWELRRVCDLYCCSSITLGFVASGRLVHQSHKSY